MSIIDKILRAGEGRTLRQLDRLASQVDALQEDFEALTDEELRGKTEEFKEGCTSTCASLFCYRPSVVQLLLVFHSSKNERGKKTKSGT